MTSPNLPSTTGPRTGLMAHWPLLLALGIGLAGAAYKFAPGQAPPIAAAQQEISPAKPATGAAAADPHAGVVGAPPLGNRAGDPHAGVVGAPPLGARNADPHAGVVGAPPLGKTSPHGNAQESTVPGQSPHATDPHGAPARAGDTVPVKTVAKAEGPLGRTVAELHAQRTALRGKPVRVRGVVVKSVSGVLGRTFIHVRDGSGSAAGADNDLTITTTLQPKVGEEIVLEGKLTTDKDFGMGYTYPVLLEDAVAVSP